MGQDMPELWCRAGTGHMSFAQALNLFYGEPQNQTLVPIVDI